MAVQLWFIGTFVAQQLPDSDGYGQNGGPIIADVNFSGTNEIVFGSFEQKSVASYWCWWASHTTPGVNESSILEDCCL